jgi:hypothetical protein
MRYCPACQRFSEGWPDRCFSCSSGFSGRVCRRGGHKNPADAFFCGICGSADLTDPVRGGRIINGVLGLFRHRGLFGLILKLTIPFLLLALIIHDLRLYLPLLAACAILIELLRYFPNLLPPWLKGPISKYVKSRRQEIEDRAKMHDSRGRKSDV